MANTTGICDTFKTELLTGTHNLGSNTIKAAIYNTTATITNATATYTATGEVPASGSYTAGGITCTAGTPARTGTVAYWQPGANINCGTVTWATAFDAVLLYNNTQTNKAIAVWNFGSTTVNGGTFQITLPTNDATNALIRLT